MKFTIALLSICAFAVSDGEMCGGIANIQCDPGFVCLAPSNSHQEQSGICIAQTCGESIAEKCPDGFDCDMQEGSWGLCRQSINKELTT
jgi:hypothetical protein